MNPFRRIALILLTTILPLFVVFVVIDYFGLHGHSGIVLAFLVGGFAFAAMISTGALDEGEFDE